MERVSPSAVDLGLQLGESLREGRFVHRLELLREFEVDRLAVGGEIDHLRQGRLGRQREIPRNGGGSGGQPGRARQQLLVVCPFPRQTPLNGRVGVEHLATEDHRSCGLWSHDPAQHPGVSTTGVDAEFEEPAVETGGGTCDTKVTGEGQVEPRPDRWSVDRGDGGESRAGDGQEPVVYSTQSVLGRVTQLGEVGAGTEGGRGTGDHERAHRGILLQRGDRVGELLAEFEREGIATPLVVERDDSDAVVGPVDPYVCHRFEPPVPSGAVRVLAAAELYPWPAVDGYRRRLNHMMRGLSTVAEVEVFCLAPPGEPQPPSQPEVSRVVTAPLVRRSGSQWLPGWARGGAPRRVEAIDWTEARRELAAWNPQVDLVWYSHVDTWAALSDLLAGVPAIVDFDNLENHLMRLRRFAGPHLGPAAHHDGAGSVATELARWATSRAFDLIDEPRFGDLYRRCSESVERVVVCSELDVARSGLDNVSVVPNGGSPPKGFQTDRRSLRGERPTLSFVGALDYEPNTDAVEWFVSSVYPLIRARVPDVQFRVVGRGAECVSVDRRTPGLVFTGPVEDLDAELALTDVSVVPIRLGAGTRLKVVEAMAAHLPLVTTTVGCEGIDLMHRDEALIADDPRRFADACLRLMSEGALRQRLADNAAALFERRYRWESIEESVGALATEIAGAAG